MHFCYKGNMYVNVLIINITLNLSFVVLVCALGKFAFSSYIFLWTDTCLSFFKYYVNVVTVGPSAYILFWFQQRQLSLIFVKEKIKFIWLLNSLDLMHYLTRIFQIILFRYNEINHYTIIILYGEKSSEYLASPGHHVGCQYSVSMLLIIFGYRLTRQSLRLNTFCV